MIIIIADFDAPIRTYYDREISTEIEGHFVSLKSDLICATGINYLKINPHFVLQFYKHRGVKSDDVIGQMLGGMLISQEKSTNHNPIYGCYVQGRNWFFSILEGKSYVISQSFDSSKSEDTRQIIFILRQLNTIIKKRLNP